MGIGAPDRSSRFQWMLDVAFPSSKFPWSSRVAISGASLSWSTQHVLLKHPVLEFIHIFDICRGDSSWTPMSQCEEWEKCFYALNHHLSNSAMRILINSMYWTVSVRVSAVLRQRARGYGERGAPDGTRELADGQAPLGRTGGPQALQWPKDVNFNGYNMVIHGETSGACGNESRFQVAWDSDICSDQGMFMLRMLDKSEVCTRCQIILASPANKWA